MKEESTFETIAKEISVRKIATPAKYFFSINESLTDLIESIHDDPEISWIYFLKDSDNVLGYITNDDLFSYVLNTPLKDMIKPIHPNRIVSSSLPLLDVLPLFEQSNLYFLIDRNEITHYLHFQDLDNLPFILCLFSLILVLERKMAFKLRHNKKKTAQAMSVLSPKRIKGLEKQLGKEERFRTTRIKLTDFKKVHRYGFFIKFLLFSEKVKIFLAIDAFVKALPLLPQEIDDFFSQTKKLRNKIAHGGSISDFLVSPRILNNYIKNLKDIIDSL